MKVTRSSSGLFQFYPKYIWTILLKALNGEYIERDILIGKKRPGNRTANYLISMDIKNPKSKGSAYLGKLRATTTTKKDEYFLFGPGENPEKSKSGQEVRKAFMLVNFEDDNIEGLGKVKKTRCIIPKWEKEYSGKTDTYDGVEDPHYLGISKDVHNIVNKHPKWSDKKKKYVYNFGSRVKESSNKNTQLVEEKRNAFTRETDIGDCENDDEISLMMENIVFQFGKYDKQVFNLDIQAPLSIFQAFGLCLSIYDAN